MFHAELTVQFLSCLEEFPRNVIRTRGRGFESLTCRNAPSLGASAAAERRCQHWRAASVGGRFARWPGSGALWLIRLTRKGIGTARRPARYLALSEQTGSDALTPDPAPAAVRPPSLATGGLPSMSHALLASRIPASGRSPGRLQATTGSCSSRCCSSRWSSRRASGHARAGAGTPHSACWSSCCSSRSSRWSSRRPSGPARAGSGRPYAACSIGFWAAAVTVAVSVGRLRRQRRPEAAARGQPRRLARPTGASQRSGP
jgi:hypothetical protein